MNKIISFVPLFDEDGNQMLVKTEKGIFEIIYNGENRPIKFTNLSDSSFITMSYDYMGRRGGKLYFNSQGTWTSTAKFFYKDYTLIEESTASNDILKEFVWDPTAGEATRPLYMKIPQGDINLFYLHDANKNVTEVTYFDTVNGIGAHYEYDSFGNTIATSRNVASTLNIITENPFRFSSEYHDDEFGLIYYNYRHYNPEIGRWISRDPIEEQGGNNLYGMCKNNMLNSYDTLGKKFINEGFVGVVQDIVWVGNGARGAAGNENVGSIQQNIPPSFVVKGKCCWVKENTGLITVKRSHNNFKQGEQGYLGKSIETTPQGAEEVEKYKYYIASSAFGKIRQHELGHISETEYIYNSTLALAEGIARSYTKENPYKEQTKNSCTTELATLISWESRVEEFEKKDRERNGVGQTFDKDPQNVTYRNMGKKIVRLQCGRVLLIEKYIE